MKGPRTTKGDGARAAACIAAALAAGAFWACRSTAPYTAPAAAINAVVAAGVAVHERSSGGCYAICTQGTICNTVTGYCVPAVQQDVCFQSDGGSTPCTPLGVYRENQPDARPPGGIGIGVSPATGSVPPPPAESSPRQAP